MIQLLFALLMSFFSGTTDLQSHTNKDRIKVMQVKYEGELQDGKESSMEITVRYLLTSRDSATMMIGFNNGGAINSMRMMDEKYKIVEKGEGEVTFNLTTTVKSWGSEGDFKLYVNLSENPLPTGRFQPMVGDYYILIEEIW